MGKQSFLKQAKIQFYILIFFVLFLILFPICLTLCIPVYIFRFIVAMLGKYFRPSLGKMVTTRSAVLATDDPCRNPSPNWNLCVWITLEGNLDFEQFRQNFSSNIVFKRDENGCLVSPEYQQYFHQWLGFLFWKWEKNFQIEDHMKYYFNDSRDKTTTDEELRDVIKNLTAKPFEKYKSPWEFLFIMLCPNYVSSEDESKNKSVIILRVHHGFCDGYSILWLLLKEVNKVGMERVAKPIQIKKPSYRKLIDKMLFCLRAPYDFFTMIVKSKDRNEWHLFGKALQQPFNTGFTPQIPLRYIKDIKNANSVSFTSVVMAALTGGLRNTMIRQGVKVPKKFTTAIAVPMPGHPEKLCNHFIFSFMSLPVGTDCPAERLLKIEKSYMKLKKSPVTAFSFMMIPVFGGLFTWMMSVFQNNEFSTVLTSNFPGPAESGDFIGGGGNNRVLDMNFNAQVGVGNVGIGFFMMSYAHGMRIITSVDKSILPTDAAVDQLNVNIMEELETLRQLQWTQV